MWVVHEINYIKKRLGHLYQEGFLTSENILNFKKPKFNRAIPWCLERRAKKLAKLHFACQGRGEHCLYSRTFFTMRTRNPRVWIHLMFLALQARSQSALSSRDSSVSSLKNCWDILKCENKTFLTLVTSAFPCAKVCLSLCFLFLTNKWRKGFKFKIYYLF